MKELINTIKDFKIIPDNFNSSGAFKLISHDDNTLTAELILANDEELNDYNENSTVEIFGVNDIGLVYFETKIISKNNKTITLAATNDYSVIQRREYSRVELNQGKIIFKDKNPDFIQSVEDISAGGIKFISNEPLEPDKSYDIEISLSNNMNIRCSLMPIRIYSTDDNGKKTYIISGKFTNLETMDRIVLVQYAFKIKMEEQSKENN